MPENIYRFVLTTSATDSNGNIADPLGWDLKRYKANPVVLWNHGWLDQPIGKTLNIEATAHRLTAEIQLADTHLAQEIATLIEGGYVRGASPGWLPIEWEARKDAQGRFLGIHSHSQELIEASIVGIPANPDALRIARLNDGRILTASQEWLDIITSAPPQPQEYPGQDLTDAEHLAEAQALLDQLKAFHRSLRGEP